MCGKIGTEIQDMDTGKKLGKLGTGRVDRW